MNQFRYLRYVGSVVRTRFFLPVLLLAVTVPVTVYLSPYQSQARGSGLQVPQKPPIFGETWARTELFFGTSKPDGTVVSDDEFKLFLNREITPRFPDGLTQLTGFGQFKNSSGVIIQEKSIVIILLYPLSDLGASNRIEAIRTIYKQMFQQESVLRVDSRAGVSF